MCPHKAVEADIQEMPLASSCEGMYYPIVSFLQGSSHVLRGNFQIGEALLYQHRLPNHHELLRSAYPLLWKVSRPNLVSVLLPAPLAPATTVSSGISLPSRSGFQKRCPAQSFFQQSSIQGFCVQSQSPHGLLSRANRPTCECSVPCLKSYSSSTSSSSSSPSSSATARANSSTRTGPDSDGSSST
jgi:hypothetical protein